MILTENIFKKILSYRNTNIIVSGSNIKLLTNFNTVTKEYNTIEYKQCEYIYIINCMIKKQNIMELLTEISMSPYYYSDNICKKVIILLNVQYLNKATLLMMKGIIDKSYLSVCYILHTLYMNQLDKTLQSRFIQFILQPSINDNDDTITITYNRIIKLIKKPVKKKLIDEIRQICYMYYMNHTSSIELQKYIVEQLKTMKTLPNEIKYKIINDMCDINYIYNYSYRKPIYLECIIYCLFKHLENYTM